MSNDNESKATLLNDNDSVGEEYKKGKKQIIEIRKYQIQHWREDYSNLIQYPSIKILQEHFSSVDISFMMGITREITTTSKNLSKLKQLFKESNKEQLLLSKEQEGEIVAMLQEDMEIVTQDLKETLLLFRLGLVPLYGHYIANEKGEEWKMEVIVLVPMSSNYTGYDQSIYSGEGLRQATARDYDFSKLAFDLKDEYNREKIIVTGPSNIGELCYSHNKVKELGSTESLSTEDIKEYARQLMNNNGTQKKGQKTLWELTSLMSVSPNLYAEDDLAHLCVEIQTKFATRTIQSI